jgi:hypothetical protein
MKNKNIWLMMKTKKNTIKEALLGVHTICDVHPKLKYALVQEGINDLQKALPFIKKTSLQKNSRQ